MASIGTLKWYLNVPLTLTICVFGIIGNIISALVWKRLNKKARPGNALATIYFILLPLIDICVLIFTIFVDVLPLMGPESLIKSFTYNFAFVYVFHPLHFYFLFASIFLVAVISFERLKLIMYPLLRLTLSKRTTSVSIMFVFAVSIVVNLPSFSSNS